MSRAHSSAFRAGHCCQESYQKRAISPLPISQKACRVTSCLFCLAAVQIKEPRLSPFHRIKFFSAIFGAYFFLQSLAQRSLGFFSQRHQILALRTLFTIKGSLKPSPPCSLGLQSFSQLTSAIFFSLLRPCQMKFLCKLLMVVRMNFGAASVEKT